MTDESPDAATIRELKARVHELEQHVGPTRWIGPDEFLPNEANDTQRHLEQIEAEVERRFQDLCHNLKTGDCERFCDGCEAYQIEQFGWSPITKLKERIRELEQLNGQAFNRGQQAAINSIGAAVTTHHDKHTFDSVIDGIKKLKKATP